jgi:hypothetical protein
VTGKAQFPALSAAARVIGILLGQLSKISAALDLLEQRFGLGLGFGIRLGCTAGKFDQDVARAGLLGNLVLGLVRVVIGLDLLLAGLGGAAGNLVSGEGEVDDLTFFRDRVGVARGVLGEEGLQVGLAGIDLLAEIVSGNNRIVKLDLDVLLAVLVADLVVADRDAGGDELLKAADGDVVANLALEGVGGDVELLGDELAVLLLADELAIGKENLAELAGVEHAANIVSVGRNAQACGLGEQNLLQDELLADAGQEDVDVLLRNALALHLLLSHFLDVNHRYFFAGKREAAVPVRVDSGIGVVRNRSILEDTWNQVNDHAQDECADSDGYGGLNDLIVFLQKANHGRVTTFYGWARPEFRG